MTGTRPIPTGDLYHDRYTSNLQLGRIPPLVCVPSTTGTCTTVGMCPTPAWDVYHYGTHPISTPPTPLHSLISFYTFLCIINIFNLYYLFSVYIFIFYN